jgi:methionyl-tRNA formyltransferase
MRRDYILSNSYNQHMKISLVFFGSFQSYSVQVLDKLLHSPGFEILAVITTPPAPKGRHLHLAKTEVQNYSEYHNIPCFPLETLDDKSLETLRQSFKSLPDFLVVAGYGKLIPTAWLTLPKIMAVNPHQSLLPFYPGRCPAEWAILNGETETGVTLIQMNPKFDAGDILAQKTLPITPDDNRQTLYQKLYDLSADLLVSTLPFIVSGQVKPQPQPIGKYFYARQITRQDGFIPYLDFQNFLQHLQNERAQPDAGKDRAASTRDCECEKIKRKFRAFEGWPGVWTTNPEGKRVKLISINPLLYRSYN